MPQSAKMLTGFRDLLQNDVRIKSSIKTIKRGIFYPSAVFPVLAILPLSENISTYLSAGKYYYKRQYSLQLYLKGMNIQAVRKESIKLIEQTKFVLQEYTQAYNLDNEFNILFAETSFQDYSDTQDGIVALSIQNFEVTSVEQMPNTRTREDITIDVRPDTLGEYLNDLILEARRRQWGKMAKVNSVYYPIAPPTLSNADMPAVVIVPASDIKERYSQGRDLSKNVFQVQIWTKLSDHELNLMFLLEILDDLRALLFKVRTLEDRCWNMSFDGVSFQFLSDPDTLKAYLANINITYDVFENSRR